MKKQFPILALLLLTACPQSSQEEISAPSDPLPQAVEAYPQENLPCCWQDLNSLNANYANLAREAYNGEATALVQLFKLSRQTSAQTTHIHGTVLASILHHLGDQRFAYTLQDFRNQGGLKQNHPLFEETLFDTLRNELEAGLSLSVDAETSRSKLLDYPLTAALLNYHNQSSAASNSDAGSAHQ